MKPFCFHSFRGNTSFILSLSDFRRIGDRTLVSASQSKNSLVMPHIFCSQSQMSLLVQNPPTCHDNVSRSLPSFNCCPPTYQTGLPSRLNNLIMISSLYSHPSLSHSRTQVIIPEQYHTHLQTLLLHHRRGFCGGHTNSVSSPSSTSY